MYVRYIYVKLQSIWARFSMTLDIFGSWFKTLIWTWTFPPVFIHSSQNMSSLNALLWSYSSFYQSLSVQEPLYFPYAKCMFNMRLHKVKMKYSNTNAMIWSETLWMSFHLKKVNTKWAAALYVSHGNKTTI